MTTTDPTICSWELHNLPNLTLFEDFSHVARVQRTERQHRTHLNGNARALCALRLALCCGLER